MSSLRLILEGWIKGIVWESFLLWGKDVLEFRKRPLQLDHLCVDLALFLHGIADGEKLIQIFDLGASPTRDFLDWIETKSGWTYKFRCKLTVPSFVDIWIALRLNILYRLPEKTSHLNSPFSFPQQNDRKVHYFPPTSWNHHWIHKDHHSSSAHPSQKLITWITSCALGQLVPLLAVIAHVSANPVESDLSEKTWCLRINAICGSWGGQSTPRKRGSVGRLTQRAGIGFSPLQTKVVDGFTSLRWQVVPFDAPLTKIIEEIGTGRIDSLGLELFTISWLWWRVYSDKFTLRIKLGDIITITLSSCCCWLSWSWGRGLAREVQVQKRCQALVLVTLGVVGRG